MSKSRRECLDPDGRCLSWIKCKAVFSMLPIMITMIIFNPPRWQLGPSALPLSPSFFPHLNVLQEVCAMPLPPHRYSNVPTYHNQTLPKALQTPALTVMSCLHILHLLNILHIFHFCIFCIFLHILNIFYFAYSALFANFAHFACFAYSTYFASIAQFANFIYFAYYAYSTFCIGFSILVTKGQFIQFSTRSWHPVSTRSSVSQSVI